MAETAGLVGVGLQLGKTALELYDLFSDAQSFGSDYSDCLWQIENEQHRLKRWEEFWSTGGGTLDPNDDSYRHAVETLARIVALFADADSLNSKYGIKASARKRHRISELFRRKPSSPIALGSNAIKTPQSSTRPLDKNFVPDLDDEIARIEDATKKLQQMLPAYRKLKWAIADKAKFTELGKQLKRYNDGLYGVLPPQQTGRPTPPAPPAILIFQKFNVPIQLLVKRNNKFVGRVDLLDKLHKILDPSQNQNQRTRRVAVLHGLGGMGKTQIVTEYAYRNSPSYTSIFWVDATSKATLAHSSLDIMEQIISHYRSKWHDSAPDFVEIGAVLGLPGFIKSTGEIDEICPPELVARAVKEWLSNSENDKWLIVFDNHDDFESVKMSNFLPPCDFGSIIVSTRRLEVAAFGDVAIEIGGIEKMSGVSILLSSAGKDPGLSGGPDYEEASKIAERLGYLPLALEQAGGYISAMKIEFSEYIPLFNKNFGNLASANHPKLSEMYRNDTLLTTWNISFACLPPHAYNLLALCAFLVNGNQEVPQEILDRAEGFISWFPTGGDFINLGVKSLLSFSMAKRKTYQNERSLCFHPLILEWTRNYLGLWGGRTYIMGAITLLAGCIRSINSGEMKNTSAPTAEFERGIFPYINVVIRHLRELPDPSMMSVEVEFADALVEIGSFLADHSRLMEAEEVLEKSLEFHEEKANHEPMIYQRYYHHAVSNLGWIYYKKNRLEESEKLLERALSGQEQMFGKDTLGTVATMGRMSAILNIKKNHKEALEMQDRVIACFEKFKGMEHPDTLSSMRHKGELLGREGDPVEAEELLRRTLAGQEVVFGKSHPSTLRTIKILASAVEMQGPEKRREALELFKVVLATQEETLGPQHQETILTVFAMANNYYQDGRKKEALESYKRVLEGWKKEFGIEHPDTLTAMKAVAEIHYVEKRYQEALDLYQQALVGQEAVFGKESLNAGTTAQGIGRCFYGLGKYTDAIRNYRKALAIQERVLGDAHLDTISTIRGLAYALQGAGGHKEALTLLQQALPAQEKAFGKTDLVTLGMRHNMGLSIAAQGRQQEALDLWESTLAIQEEVHGKDHPQVLSSIPDMAMAMRKLGRYQESIEFYKRALAGQERLLGPKDPLTLRAVWGLACAKYDNRDYEEAMELLQRALAGQEEVLGKVHPETLLTTSIIASYLNHQERYQESAELHRRVLAGRREILGSTHPSTIATTIELSEVEAKLQ